MAGVSGMAGTPWHTETIHMSEKDNRRHRAHCVHYNNENKTCRKRAVKCYGSSHCSYYKESPEKTLEPENDLQIQEHGFIREKNAIILFKPGTHVMHKTYGRGVVSRVESKIIRIQFYHHGFENLQIEDCLKNDLLKLEMIKNQ